MQLGQGIASSASASRQKGTMDGVVALAKHLQAMIVDVEQCSARIHDVVLALYGARPEEASEPTPGNDSLQSMFSRMQLAINQLQRRITELEGGNRN